MVRGAGAQLSRRPRYPAVDPSPQPEIVNARDAITAEPLDSPDQAADASRQPEIMNARDTMTVEPLDLPDVREQRGRGSRNPSPDGVTFTRRVDPRSISKMGGRAPPS